MSQEDKVDVFVNSDDTDQGIDNDYTLDPDNITRFVILANGPESASGNYTLVQENFENGEVDGMDDFIEEVGPEDGEIEMEYHPTITPDYEEASLEEQHEMNNFIFVEEPEDSIIEDTTDIKLEYISNENSMETPFNDASEDPIGNAATDDKLYSCSSCKVSFTDVVKHIHEKHPEQKVLLEMCDDEEDDTNVEQIIEDTRIGDEILEDIIQFDEEIVPDPIDHSNKEYFKNKNWKMPQILNTLKEEECTDKDGRLYTRKVVQIEKFWDKAAENGISAPQEEARTPVPVLFQYIENEDGTMTMAQVLPQGLNMEIKLEPGTKVKNIYHCSRCFSQCADMEEFKAHACQEDADEIFKCDTCTSAFKTQKMLTAHMKVHKTVKTSSAMKAAGGPYMCFECDTIFPSNKSLRLHRRMHGPIKQKHIEQFYGAAGPEAMDELPEGELGEPREQFQCQVCKKSYDKAFEKIHMGVHSGEQEHNCHICNRKFFTDSNLAMHMRVHAIEKPQTKRQKGELPYVCGFCDRQFARPHEKVKHERIHTGEKPHECEICGKRFRVSYCLTLHMRTHTGARPYECPHCHKRFKAHSVYNHHLMTHSDIRAYKCPYCPKAFKTAVQLAGHKNSHTKPFSCTECNRPFASLYAVRGHMEIHKKQNSLKYKCSICGASYARGFALRDHMKEQHQSTVVSEDDGVVIDEALLDSHLLPEGDTIEIPIEEFEYDGTEISGTYIKIEGPIEYHVEPEL